MPLLQPLHLCLQLHCFPLIVQHLLCCLAQPRCNCLLLGCQQALLLRCRACLLCRCHRRHRCSLMPSHCILQLLLLAGSVLCTSNQALLCSS